MRLGVGLGGDFPDGTAVSGPVVDALASDILPQRAILDDGATAPNGTSPNNRGFSYRIGVVMVFRRLAHQENVFVRLGAAVGDAFWHRVGLRPDDVLAQIPAISL
jgi:hypothetical protein